MIINHDLKSEFLKRHIFSVQRDMESVHEKLGSALKINKAGDDASGLAVSEKMRSQIRGLFMAGKNTQDDISLIQTADGYLEDMTALVHRLRELAVTSANGVFQAEDRELIQIEADKLTQALQKIIDFSEFNKLSLFDGKTFRFHIGANMDQSENFLIRKLDLETLYLNNFNVRDIESANQSIGKADYALKTLLKVRADLGAMQNRLEKAYKGVMINHENTTAADSRIRDTDMAMTFSKYATLQVLENLNAQEMNTIHKLNRTLIQDILRF